MRRKQVRKYILQLQSRKQHLMRIQEKMSYVSCNDRRCLNLLVMLIHVHFNNYINRCKMLKLTFEGRFYSWEEV
jgi:hypothetical protein